MCKRDEDENRDGIARSVNRTRTSGSFFEVTMKHYGKFSPLLPEEPPDLVSLNGCRETGE